MKKLIKNCAWRAKERQSAVSEKTSTEDKTSFCDNGLAELARMKARISSINDSIISGLVDRRLKIDEMRRIAADLCHIENFIAVDGGDFMKSYFEAGVESDLVKRAISNLRSLLFDDSDKKYREYNFVHLWTDRGSGAFRFVFSNGKREFHIVIPVITDESSQCEYIKNAYLTSENLTNYYIGEKMRIEYHGKRLCMSSMGYTYDVGRLKDNIRRFINEPDVFSLPDYSYEVESDDLPWKTSFYAPDNGWHSLLIENQNRLFQKSWSD